MHIRQEEEQIHEVIGWGEKMVKLKQEVGKE